MPVSPKVSDATVSSLTAEENSALSSTNAVGRFARKYYKIWRVALSERLVYRADFFISTFLRFLPMMTTILLWMAIYDGVGQQEGKTAENSEIAGFNLNMMISYLLLVHISRMFSSMPGLAGGIARDIREGTMKKYLLQPIDMVAYLMAYRIAHKMAYIMMSAIPYAILFYLCRDFLPSSWPDPLTFAAYIASLLMGFIIGFFFEASIGMIGFWFLEVTSFLYVIGTLTFFMSGHMFPLDILQDVMGGFWLVVLKGLPFQYLAYFPATIFLGKTSGFELVEGLLIEVIWCVVLIGICRLMYYSGLRRYSAFGG